MPSKILKKPAARPSIRKQPAAVAAPVEFSDSDSTGVAIAKDKGALLARIAAGLVLGLIVMAASIVRTRQADIQIAIGPQPVALHSKVDGCQVPQIIRFWGGGDVDAQADLPYTVARSIRDYRSMAEFIGCITTTNVERLCKRDARRALVADLKSYALVRSDTVDFAASVGRARLELTSDSVAEDVRARSRGFVPLASVDTELMGKLTELARYKLLAASDFGLFGRGAPASVKEALSAAIETADLCGG